MNNDERQMDWQDSVVFWSCIVTGVAILVLLFTGVLA